MTVLAQTPKQIIDEVLDLLDEMSLVEKIDQAIDVAYNTFTLADDDRPSAHTQFHEAISRFVQHLYASAGIPLAFPSTQSGGEAILILEQMYRGTSADGYAGAYLDALNAEQGGISLVLKRMAESIKTAERQKHIRWVYTTRILSRTWEEKCRIAEHLQDRWRDFLPSSVTSKSPSDLAHEIPFLVENSRQTVSKVIKMSR